jgi:hypothetical protein
MVSVGGIIEHIPGDPGFRALSLTLDFGNL